MTDYIFCTGPFGNSINVDANGHLVVSETAVSGRHVYSTGENGRTLAVDGAGRLLIANYTPSGITLPAASGYVFGERYYVVASGFYLRGISDWERVTTA